MPLIADLNIPPAYEERVICSIAAASEFGVPADILLAIAEVEGGKVGTISENRNGTVDVGPMQFNSAYLDRSLRKYGITANDVNQPGCYPYRLAAWRIKNHLRNDQGDIWTRAANYHSRTKSHNEVYRGKILRAARRWAGWLKAHFTTHHVSEGTYHAER